MILHKPLDLLSSVPENSDKEDMNCSMAHILL